MKEKIYTIPINEAMEKGGECPLCSIEHDLEENALEYFLGPAMMEPDVRIHTNERGFCRLHTDKMLGRKNILPLALMLQSRMDYVCESFQGKAVEKKKKMFKKEYDDTLSEKIAGLTGGCAVCERVERQLDNCIWNFAYMLLKDEDFKNRFLSSKGLCIDHFCKLLAHLKREGASGGLLADVIDLENRNLKNLADEIAYFITKFDYRNKDASWNGTEDSPQRCCTKLAGGER